MSGNVKQAIGTFLQLAGVAYLTGKGIKAEYDKYKALYALHDKEFELACAEINEVLLKAENEHLKKQLKKYENKEEEA